MWPHRGPDFEPTQRFTLTEIGEEEVRKLDEDCKKQQERNVAYWQKAHAKASVANNPRDGTDTLVKTRETTHGDFTDNSYYSQRMKEALHLMNNWNRMNCWAKEAAEMIVHKLARAGAGKWDEADHWDDIAGYARLVADRCRGTK